MKSFFYNVICDLNTFLSQNSTWVPFSASSLDNQILVFFQEPVQSYNQAHVSYQSLILYLRQCCSLATCLCFVQSLDTFNELSLLNMTCQFLHTWSSVMKWRNYSHHHHSFASECYHFTQVCSLKWCYSIHWQFFLQ